jgi:hypothetical protein
MHQEAWLYVVLGCSMNQADRKNIDQLAEVLAKLEVLRPLQLSCVDCLSSDHVVLKFIKDDVLVDNHLLVLNMYLLNGVLLSCNIASSNYLGAIKNMTVSSGINPKSRQNASILEVQIDAGVMRFALDGAIMQEVAWPIRN